MHFTYIQRSTTALSCASQGGRLRLEQRAQFAVVSMQFAWQFARGCCCLECSLQVGQIRASAGLTSAFALGFTVVTVFCQMVACLVTLLRNFYSRTLSLAGVLLLLCLQSLSCCQSSASRNTTKHALDIGDKFVGRLGVPAVPFRRKVVLPFLQQLTRQTRVRTMSKDPIS